MFAFNNWVVIKELMDNAPLVGLSVFLMSYVYYAGVSVDKVNEAVVALSVGLLFYALSNVISKWAEKEFQRRFSSTIEPSVIILTAGDERR